MRTNRLDTSILRMPHFSMLVRGIVVCCAMVSGTAWGQLPQNRLYAIFPPGGQAGTTVDLTLTNSADGDEVSGLYASHPGITAVQKSTFVNGNKVPVANQFQIKIAADVPPGIYDLRSHGLFGVSNPRSFVVSNRKEVQESEGNNTIETATPIEQNTVVNARAGSAGDIDFYKVAAKAGQRLIVECWAKRIDSRIEATVELYAPSGRRLAFSRNEDRGDPLIDYVVPADGEYLIRVYDFLYAGNNDYFYRLIAHSGAYVDYLLPPAGVPGTTGEFAVYGRNLPGGTKSGVKVGGNELDVLKVKIPLPADTTSLQPGTFLQPFEAGLDGFTYRLPTPEGLANPVMIQFSTAPVQLEQEPNDQGEQATKITVPGEAAGQFQARNDIDYYQFEAKAKSVYWIEVFGQRSGTAADPHLIVEQITRDDKGNETVKRLTAQDDVGTNLGAQGFDTRTDDPAYRFVAPADGTYRIVVRDRYFEGRGDPRMVYRVAVRAETPDFRLVALPRQPVLVSNVAALPATWDVALRKGDHAEIEVLAFRNNGFNGAINVTVAGLPAGVTCPGVTIGPGQTSARLILTSTDQAAEWLGQIQIVGKTRIEDSAAQSAEKQAQKQVEMARLSLKTLEKAVTDTQSAAKTAADKAAEQQKKAEVASVNSQAAVKTADAAKKTLAESDAALANAQKQAAAAMVAVQKTSLGFVDAAVAKATTEQQATETAVAVREAVDAKIAAQKEKDAEAEAAADKRVIATSVAAKLAMDAQATAAGAFENAAAEKAKAVAQKAAADQAVVAATANQKKANDAYLAAEKAAKEAISLAEKETAAKTAADKLASETTEQAKQAVAAKEEGTKKLAEAEGALKIASEKREAAAQKLVRAARGGTIVWSGNQTLTATSRVSRNMMLSVIKEPAPFQVSTEVSHLEVSQGAQILVPVKLAKRMGFDNKVDLTVEAAPKNVDVEKKAIEKGKDEQLVRLFVKNNAAPGTYSLLLRGQGQVSYSRNPEAAKLAETEKQAAIKAAAEAAELVKTTAEAKKAADQQAADAQAAATKAGEVLVAADIAVVAANKALEAAKAEQTKAEKATADAADDAAVKQAAEAKAAVDNKVAEATAALKKADDARAAAAKQADEAAEILKKAQAVKAEADKAAAEAVSKSTTAEAVKKTAEATATAAAKTAKAANKNVFAPSNAITITVNPAAVTLKAAVPNKGALKRGAEMKIAVTISRKNGFTGPVKVGLPLPPGVTGLTAAELTIPADQDKGELIVKATGDATEGKLPNMVLRASMDFEGQTFVDEPVEITISK